MFKMAVGVLEVGLTISVIISIQWACCAAFSPVDNYLIDCGSLSSTTMGDRTFVADSSLSSRLTTPTDILANTTLNPQSPAGMSAIYKTARIFTGPSSYSFSIKLQGRHFVRLHFFPFAYGDYNLTTATFSVSTQEVLLLNNFQLPANTSMKEYSLMIARDNLILSFAPSGNSSVAFVNAIEVISVVGDLLTKNPQTVRNTAGGDVSGQAFETVYRLNVGGPEVLPDSDPFGRIWRTDPQFLLDGSRSKNSSFFGQIYYPQEGPSNLTAPEIVYNTVRELDPSNISDTQINMTWKFNVDANCSYLMRFHFCDVVSSAAGLLRFDVRVGRWHILKNFDLSSRTYRRLATAVFTDFVLDANDASNPIIITISPPSGNATPDGELIPPNGILNGLEVMKMNFSAGSLFVVTPSGSTKSFGIKLVSSAIGSVAIVIVVLFLALKQYSGIWTPFSFDNLHHKRSAQSSMEIAEQNITAFTSDKNRNYFDYHFSLAVLQEATNCFDESCLIGNGGFGKVYKGMLRDETKVAVKRGDMKLKQGLNEFRNEIKLLSWMRHRHLVSLIGYCDEENEMILVYEYMEKGTLKSHLHGSNLPPLTWKQRLEICIGSARGLHYLHTGLARPIIHRDVKSANILLDENLMAKIADFGVSRTGPQMDQTHVSTAVKGTFGYLDPEYFRMQQLTQKSDVYSFGVVLLEVISARPVMSPTLSGEVMGLVEWGMEWLIKEELEPIVDPRIAGTIKPTSLKKFGETIARCLADYGVQRPPMGDVLWNLEYALMLQESDSDFSEINSVEVISQLGQIS